MDFKYRKWIFAAGSFLALCGFFITTQLVRARVTRSFDFDTTVRIQEKTPIRLDHFFSILSIIGRFEFTVIILIIVLILSRKLWFGLFAFALFGASHVLELVGKTILEHPGPPHMFLRTQYSDFPGLAVHSDASYPSGHSLRILFLFVVIIWLTLSSRKLHTYTKTGIIGISGIFTFLMVFSRVSLGEHWTTDVIGGSFLGIGAALAALVFF